MATENLEIIIDVVTKFDAEIENLILELESLDAIAEKVDKISIDVDVDGMSEIAALNSALALLQAQSLSVGEVNVGAIDRQPDAARGGGFDLNRVQVGQLARITTQLDDLEVGGFARTLSEADQQADRFIDSLREGNLRMGDLHNVVAQAVPLFVVMVGALPAVIGALAALATAAIGAIAALGSLATFGAIGLAMEMGDGDVMAGFKEIFNTVKEDFFSAFEPLMEDLAPLFRDGLDGLGMFFDELAARGDTLRAFSDDARSFGQFIIDFVPEALANLVQFADAFSGVFGLIADTVEGLNITEALAEFMQRATGPMQALIDILIHLAPKIAEISIGFLRVTTVILQVISAILDVLTVFGLFNEGLGIAIALALSLTSAWLLFNGVISTTVLWLGQRLLAAIGGVIVALTNYTAGTVAAAIGTHTLATAIAGLLALTGIGILIAGIGFAAQSLADDFLGTSAAIDEATSSLQEFDSVSSRFASTNPYAPTQSEADKIISRGGESSSARGNTFINTDEEETRKQMSNAEYRDWKNSQ